MSCPVPTSIFITVLGAVLAQHLEYLPGGSDIPEETQCAFAEDQREALGLAGGVAAVVPDILLAKMRPGQSIELEAHCVKGGYLTPPPSHTPTFLPPSLSADPLPSAQAHGCAQPSDCFH